jgi:UDP-glucose 4-epimerase
MTPFYGNRRVLVTGGAGFLGSHMVDSLLAQGAHVTVFDNLQSGTLDNLSQATEQILFLQADVRDYGALEAAMANQDTVFHFAANASVPRSVEDPVYDFDANARGTFNLCRAAHVHHPRKVVLASSAAVYGEPQYVPMDEKHPLEPLSPYGASKVAGEKVGMAFHRTFGLGLSVVRIFNSYGPRQPRYVIHDLIRKLQRDSSRLEVLGDGSQVRDYSHVSDTIRAFLLVGELGETDGQVYNAAGGQPISISELVRLVVELWDRGPTEIVYTGRSWAGDIKCLIADTTRLRALGFEPQCDLRGGIRDMIAWFLDFRPEGVPSV